MSDTVISSWAAHVPKGPRRDQAAAWSAAKSEGWDGRQITNRRKQNFLIGSSQVRASQKFHRIVLYGHGFYGANKLAAAPAFWASTLQTIKGMVKFYIETTESTRMY